MTVLDNRAVNTNWRGTGNKPRALIAVDLATGLYLHMTGKVGTDNRDYAWQGTRDQFTALQLAEAHAQSYELFREVAE